jgi:putative endonuclease
VPFTVYIIQSEFDGTLYTGHTNNVVNRLQRHNDGKARYTKPKRPWRLVYTEEFLSRAEAMQRETELKSFHRKDLLMQLINTTG